MVTVRESFSVKTAALYLPATARQKRDRTSTVLTDGIFSFLMPDRSTQAFVLLGFAGQDMFAFQFSSNVQTEKKDFAIFSVHFTGGKGRRT